MVEIIPKPKKREFPWSKVTFYISIALLAAVASAYFILHNMETNLSNHLVGLKSQIELYGTPEDKAMEKEVFNQKQNIENFSVLLQDHEYPLNFFLYLQETTHPEVWFSSFQFDSEKLSASLSGKTVDFETMDQQLQIFRSQELIKKAELKDPALGEEGGATFALDLIFSPEIFKYSTTTSQ